MEQALNHIKKKKHTGTKFATLTVLLSLLTFLPLAWTSYFMRKYHGIIMPPFMLPTQIHLNISMKWQIFTNLGNDKVPPQGIPHTAWLNIKLTVASPTLPTSTWTSKKYHSVICHNHPPSIFSRSVCCFNFLPPIIPKCQPCEFLIWKQHQHCTHGTWNFLW